MLAEHLDTLLEARASFFTNLGVPPEQVDHVVDLRHVAWNGDHGVSWWRDENGRMQEVRFRDYIDRDGLTLYRGKSRDLWAWYVFDKTKLDESLEY
jgi:hypothetical protein